MWSFPSFDLKRNCQTGPEGPWGTSLGGQQLLKQTRLPALLIPHVPLDFQPLIWFCKPDVYPSLEKSFEKTSIFPPDHCDLSGKLWHVWRHILGWEGSDVRENHVWTRASCCSPFLLRIVVLESLLHKGNQGPNGMGKASGPTLLSDSHTGPPQMGPEVMWSL